MKKPVYEIALLKPTYDLRFLGGVLQQLWIPEPTGGQMPKQVWKDVPKVSFDPKEPIFISSEVKNRLIAHASKINGAWTLPEDDAKALGVLVMEIFRDA